MDWPLYVSHFLGGVFMANAVPHVVNGMSGRAFPTLVASPPGKGLSSPFVNVLYGAVNLAVGYVLLFQVGEFSIRRMPDVFVAGAGGLLLASALSRVLASFNGRDQDGGNSSPRSHQR
jgi:hypothetical protein